MIHEKSLIRPENLNTHDKLVIDGIDVSGHWSTFIQSRVVIASTRSVPSPGTPTPTPRTPA